MAYEHSGAQPPYAPNSYGGPMADPARGADLDLGRGGRRDGQRAANVKHAEDDDFGQAGTLYRETMNDDQPRTPCSRHPRTRRRS